MNRKRVIIIGSRDNNADLMFPERITDITEPLTTRDAIGDLPLVEDYFENLPIPYSSKAKNDYQVRMRKGSKQLFNHWSVAHTEQTKSIIALVPDGGNYKDLPKKVIKKIKKIIAPNTETLPLGIGRSFVLLTFPSASRSQRSLTTHPAPRITIAPRENKSSKFMSGIII